MKWASKVPKWITACQATWGDGPWKNTHLDVSLARAAWPGPGQDHGDCQEQHPAVVSASPRWGRSPQTRYGQAEEHIETFSAMLWTIFSGEGWDAALCEPCSAITLLPRTCSGAGGQEAKFLKHVSSKAEGLLICYPASGTGYTTSTVKINVGKVPHSQLCCCFEKNHDPGSTSVK